MRRPTTLDDAARVLVDLADVDGNPTAPYDVRYPPELDPLGALTRRELDDVEVRAGSLRTTIGARMQRAREARAARFGVDLDAPPVLVSINGERLHRIAEPVRETSRPSVVVPHAPGELAPTPSSSHALTVAALAARDAAAQVEAWGRRLPRSQRRKALGEAGAYRDYGRQVEALVPSSFAWLDDLDDPAPTSSPPFPQIPATLRGTARLATTSPRSSVELPATPRE